MCPSSLVALYLSVDGSSIERSLNMEDSVPEAVSSWPEGSPSKLLFMIRLFTQSIIGIESKNSVASRLGKPIDVLSNTLYWEIARVKDNALLQLQYQQALYNVITGQYVMGDADALYLGALNFINKFEEYQPLRHRAGFLGQRIVEFVPTKLLKTKSIEQWEGLLLESVRDLWQAKYSVKSDSSYDESHSPSHGNCTHYNMQYCIV
jgi:hypothetical protein